MAKMKKLEDLFHDTLKDVYFAEKKILASLPKMAKAAQHAGLKAAFEKHLGETEGQIDRLEQVFAEIDKKPQSKTCDAIVGGHAFVLVHNLLAFLCDAHDGVTSLALRFLVNFRKHLL